MTRLAKLLIPALLVSTAAFAMPSSGDTPATVRSEAQMQAARSIFIRGGCPAGLDKVCVRRGGKLKCRCQS